MLVACLECSCGLRTPHDQYHPAKLFFQVGDGLQPEMHSLIHSHGRAKEALPSSAIRSYQTTSSSLFDAMRHEECGRSALPRCCIPAPLTKHQNWEIWGKKKRKKKPWKEEIWDDLRSEAAWHWIFSLKKGKAPAALADFASLAARSAASAWATRNSAWHSQKTVTSLGVPMSSVSLWSPELETWCWARRSRFSSDKSSWPSGAIRLTWKVLLSVEQLRFLQPVETNVEKALVLIFYLSMCCSVFAVEIWCRDTLQNKHNCGKWYMDFGAKTGRNLVFGFGHNGKELYRRLLVRRWVKAHNDSIVIYY